MATRTLNYSSVLDIYSYPRATPIKPEDGSPTYYEYYADDPEHDEDDKYLSGSLAKGHIDPIDYTKHLYLCKPCSHTDNESWPAGYCRC